MVKAGEDSGKIDSQLQDQSCRYHGEQNSQKIVSCKWGPRTFVDFVNNVTLFEALVLEIHKISGQKWGPTCYILFCHVSSCHIHVSSCHIHISSCVFAINQLFGIV